MYCKEIISHTPCRIDPEAALLPERNTYAAPNAVHSLGEDSGAANAVPEKAPSICSEGAFSGFCIKKTSR